MNYELQKLHELLHHFYNLTNIKICIYGEKNIKTDSLEILKTLMCKLVEGADCLK